MIPYLTCAAGMWTGRAPGVRRVACIGDSVMLGAGVPRSQNFSAFLETALNETFGSALFVADNWGMRGINLWNIAGIIENCAPAASCDAIVFSMIFNDANLFDPNLFNAPPLYPVPPQGPESNRRWADHDDEIVVALKRIVQTGRRLGAPVIPVWYSWTADDGAAGERAAAACAAVGLPFIDTWPVFRAMGFDDRDPRLRVSAVDGHPGVRAHDVAARHVVREIKRGGWFQSLLDPSAPAVGAVEAEAAAAAMENLGCPPLEALRWRHDAAEAKSRASRRRRVTPSKAEEASVAETLRRVRGELSRCWNDDAAASPPDPAMFAAAHRALLRVDETLSAAMAFSGAPLARRLAERAPAAAVFVDEAALDAAAAALAAAADLTDGPALVVLANHIRSVSAIWRACGAGAASGETEDDVRAALIRLAGVFLNEAADAAAMLAAPVARRLRPALPALEPGAFHTDIFMHCRPPRLERTPSMFLELSVRHDAPARSAVRDGANIAFDGEPAVYHFQLPKLVRGVIDLVLWDWGGELDQGLAIFDRLGIVNVEAGENVELALGAVVAGATGARIEVNGLKASATPVHEKRR